MSVSNPAICCIIQLAFIGGTWRERGLSAGVGGMKMIAVSRLEGRRRRWDGC